jgi:hypothetical protein
MSAAIRVRNEGLPRPVRDIAWKAQERLHRRYARMSGRGVCKQKTVTAIARELTGFVWAIGQAQRKLARLRERRAAQPADERRADKGESSPSL